MNAAFWKEISNFLSRPENQSWKPRLVAGDCNVVEDMMDRLPMREDPENTTEALDDLKMELGLKDGWRDTNPSKKQYTFSRNDSQSQLDRIYVTDNILQTARQWKITEVGIDGVDHGMVSVEIVHEQSPLIGRGRWSLSKQIIKKKEFKVYVKNRGKQAIEEASAIGNRSAEQNPQRALASFIKDTIKKAREIEKSNISTYQQEVSRIQKEIQKVSNDPTDTRQDREKTAVIHDLKKKLKNMEVKGHEMRKRHSAAKDRLIGETICKEWVSANKERKPRDVIYALEKPLTEQPQGEEPPLLPRPEYEKHSRKMAELARDYHERLQKLGLDTDPEEREQATTEVLNKIDKVLTEEQAEEVGKELEREEIEFSLKHSKNGSSAGINGLPYEFWKSQADIYRQDSRQEGTDRFDILGLLLLAYNDLRNHGVDKTTKFAEGWMCPIYKKGDRNQISNYRPITLLNTDYKIFTKALAIRLAKVCPDIIHPDQAGFMPGRQISEQTRLIRMIVDYAEYAEKNGMLVALDQEKAYNKVAHDYLWKTMDRFAFPRPNSQELI